MNLTPEESMPDPSIRMRVSVSGTRLTQTVTFNEVQSDCGVDASAHGLLVSRRLPPSQGRDPSPRDRDQRSVYGRRSYNVAPRRPKQIVAIPPPTRA